MPKQLPALEGHSVACLQRNRCPNSSRRLRDTSVACLYRNRSHCNCIDHDQQIKDRSTRGQTGGLADSRSFETGGREAERSTSLQKPIILQQQLIMINDRDQQIKDLSTRGQTGGLADSRSFETGGREAERSTSLQKPTTMQLQLIVINKSHRGKGGKSHRGKGGQPSALHSHHCTLRVQKTQPECQTTVSPVRTNSRSASLWFPVVLRKALVLLLFQTTAESSSGFDNGLCHVKTRNQLSRTCPLCKGKRAGPFFVVFFRFQKSLGPRQPHKHDKQLCERVLTTRKRTKTEHKLVCHCSHVCLCC
jgi:hypothetical protein